MYSFLLRNHILIGNNEITLSCNRKSASIDVRNVCQIESNLGIFES